MRKIWVIPLVMLLLCSFTASLNADEEIKLYLNGTEVYTDTPPQIINGRTMVPVRVVAENLGLGVTWDGSVKLTSDAPPKDFQDIPVDNSSLEIIGPDDFKATINAALNKMDANTRDYVTSHIHQAILDNLHFALIPNSNAAIDKNNICYFRAGYYEGAKTRLSQNDLALMYVAFLAHEATHAALQESGMDQIHSDKNQEYICDLTALNAIVSAGASKDGAIYKALINHFNSELDL